MLQRNSITVAVRNTELHFHCCTNGFHLHLCESQNCVFTGGPKAFNYTYCAKHRIPLFLVEQLLWIARVLRKTELGCHWWSNGFQLHMLCEADNCVFTGGATALNYNCYAKHRISLSLVLQRLSITLVVQSTELRFPLWSNGFQLHLYEAQNWVATGGATAFNYTCFAKHRIALSLVLQWISITLVMRNTELRCHCWSNGFQLQLWEA